MPRDQQEFIQKVGGDGTTRGGIENLTTSFFVILLLVPFLPAFGAHNIESLKMVVSGTFFSINMVSKLLGLKIRKL